MTRLSSIILLLLLATGLRASTYSTSFISDENPLSEAGRWINGKTTGLDWSDCAITNGLAVSHQTSENPPGFPVNDATAILIGTWGPSQTASGTLYFDRSGTLNDQYAEVELRLRTTITANVNSGYEILFCANILPKRSGYVYIVRWNGPFNDYDDLSGGGVSGPQYDLFTGSVISATITNSSANSATIRAYINGTNVLTAVDTSCFNSGSPGIGFDMSGDLTQRTNYGFSSFVASDGATALNVTGTIRAGQVIPP